MDFSPTDNEEIENISLDYISPSTSFSFDFISYHSSPPIIMELLLNNFHYPEVGVKLAKMENSSSTFFWYRGRMGSRA